MGHGERKAIPTGFRSPTMGVLRLQQEGRVFARDGGLVESEENGAEECCSVLVWVGLQLRLDTHDKCRADGREQTGLRGQISQGKSREEPGDVRKSDWY